MTAILARCLRERGNLLLSCATVVTVLVVWQALSAVVGSVLFPSPSDTFFMGLAIAASLTRIAAGFAIGSVLGATVGFVMGYFPLGRAIGAPLVHRDTTSPTYPCTLPNHSSPMVC